MTPLNSTHTDTLAGLDFKPACDTHKCATKAEWVVYWRPCLCPDRPTVTLYCNPCIQTLLKRVHSGIWTTCHHCRLTLPIWAAIRQVVAL